MDILENISLVQREAILHRGSSLLLLAGAGSGKTLVITRKIAYLIKECEVPPEKIMAVTFTNKAANEMKNRVCELLPEIKPYRLFVKTFHSACLRILKENAHYIGYKSDFIILDEGDKLSIIKKLMKENEVPKRIAPKGIIKFISSIKNELEDSITYDRHIFEDIYNRYLEYELKENLMDFDDLILYTIKLFEKENSILNYYRERFKYILVDEFQDTNPQQYKLIKLLAKDAGNDLTVVGDDDQSIYAFRGATIVNILNFENDFPNTRIIRLEENYRCPRDIVEALKLINKSNIENISVDFICGLPLNDKEQSKKDILQAFDLLPKIKHISLYYLELNDSLKNKWRDFLPAEEDCVYYYNLAKETIESFGLIRYEISNYAFSNYESIHNSGYWNLKDYLGIGAGAFGCYKNNR